MKKISIPAILLVVAMGSCSQNETSIETISSAESDDLVSINVAMGKTRGTDLTTDLLEDSEGVKLHINDGVNINDAYDFEAEGSDWSQSTTSLTWGNISLPAHFFSMHDGTSQSLSVVDGSATLAYEVTDASSTHNDLVFHASELNAMPAGGTINLFHKHALSKIHLYAATGGNKVYVARVNMVNVDGEGTITIEPVDADDLSTATGVTWSNGTSNETQYEYYYLGDYDETDTDTGTVTEAEPSALVSTTDGSVIINSAPEAPMMIIPQLLEAATSTQITTATDGIDDTYIEVIYYMTDSADQAIVGYSSVEARPDASLYITSDQDKAMYVMAAFPLGYEFAENKEYDISLGLGKSGSSGGILVVDNYVDRDGVAVELTLDSTGVTFTPDVPGIDVGDNILAGSDDALDIVVTAIDWEDGTDTSVE